MSNNIFQRQDMICPTVGHDLSDPIACDTCQMHQNWLNGDAGGITFSITPEVDVSQIGEKFTRNAIDLHYGTGSGCARLASAANNDRTRH